MNMINKACFPAKSDSLTVFPVKGSGSCSAVCAGREPGATEGEGVLWCQRQRSRSSGSVVNVGLVVPVPVLLGLPLPLLLGHQPHPHLKCWSWGSDLKHSALCQHPADVGGGSGGWHWTADQWAPCAAVAQHRCASRCKCAHVGCLAIAPSRCCQMRAGPVTVCRVRDQLRPSGAPSSPRSGWLP